MQIADSESTKALVSLRVVFQHNNPSQGTKEVTDSKYFCDLPSQHT
jgi:hypothetical protein